MMTGPLVPFADAYRLELRVRGYTPLTTVNLLRQVARLSRWLEAGGLVVAESSGGRIDAFLAFQRAGGRHRAGWSRPGLLEVLRGMGVAPVDVPTRVSSPTEALLASFERYLLAERALAVGTARAYVGHARRFLDGSPRATDWPG